MKKFLANAKNYVESIMEDLKNERTISFEDVKKIGVDENLQLTNDNIYEVYNYLIETYGDLLNLDRFDEISFKNFVEDHELMNYEIYEIKNLVLEDGEFAIQYAMEPNFSYQI